jgi:hypothetical protein
MTEAQMETPANIKAAKTPREISSIAFPYMDLDDAIVVARVMHSRGGVPMDRDQLAAAFGQVPTSGAFNNKISTAKMFGLVDNASGRYQLTSLGFDILDPEREQSSKAEAFLNIPLYRRLFDEFKGRQLPPKPLGLETTFVSFGVSSKQKERARQAFEKSARSAGFFATSAEDRLVQPVIGARAVQNEDTRPSPPDEGESIGSLQSRSAGQATTSLPPFIMSLLAKLPPEGAQWSAVDRAKWLNAANHFFDLVYDAGNGQTVVVEVKKVPE